MKNTAKHILSLCSHISKLALTLQILRHLPDTLYELGLGHGHGDVKHALRHPALQQVGAGSVLSSQLHLVVTVHQPDKLALGLPGGPHLHTVQQREPCGAVPHLLAAGTVHRAHYL